MANVYWLGSVPVTPGVRRVTFGGVPAAGNTVTVTVTGPGKFVSYTVLGTDTLDTIASQFARLWNGSPDGEVDEISAAVDPNNSAAVLFTGPADGATFALTASATGGGVTATASNVTTETGPRDAANVANYSTGALPAGGDTLIFRDVTNGPQYNLTALTAIALAQVMRYASFAGSWGLPERSRNGYAEYRTRFLELSTPLMLFFASPNDSTGQFRWRSTLAGATTINISGQSNPGGSVGDDPQFEVYGLAGASVLNSAGGSVGVAIRKQQTASLSGPTSVNVTDSYLRLGDGCTLNGVQVTNTLGSIAANYTTLGQAGTSDLTVTGSATAGTSTAVDGGTLRWQSTGTPNTTDVAADATLDLSLAPARVAAFTLKQHKTSTVLNPAGRITTPWTRQLIHCDESQVSYVGPPSETLTVN